MLAKDTFGSTKASEVLTERLNIINEKRYTTYVTITLSNSNKIVNEILKIADYSIAAYLLQIHSESVMNNIYNKSILPESIRTYTNNVAQSKIKRAKEQIYNESLS